MSATKWFLESPWGHQRPVGLNPTGSLWTLLAICTSPITQDERQHRIHLGTQWNSQLTERAGQLGDSERLAAAGQQGADSALFAATAALARRLGFGNCSS